MPNTPCHHKISINLNFLKYIFGVEPNTAKIYSTLTTRVDIINNMSIEDLHNLADWINEKYKRVDKPTTKENNVILSDKNIDASTDPIKNLVKRLGDKK
jgi:hypothetical protein